MENTRVTKVLKNSRKHWVGNGFYVSSLWSPGSSLYKYTNPFLMLDYASPMMFEPSEERRGVGVHPHRGFETVTFAIEGEVEHRDSSGGGGVIFPGDVQWMTAASGVVHDEFHSDKFTREGGVFSMVQLWVNLASEFKMSEPKYQSIKSEEFDRVSEDGHEVKVIAGLYKDHEGACSTYSPINVFEVNFSKNSEFEYFCLEKMTTLVLILDGEVEISNENYVKEQALAIEKDGDKYSLRAKKGSKLLIFSGVPIEEPVASYGPFVMNTKEELVQAVEDFNANRMGNL
ncbi:pirin family protein [Halobacteriovorax sp. JY17]|uniref:pirin family protein n=1 Tax=Halobacteriovorax sp. JY17 TaxID=2014617 RepID=UPI000C4E7EA2|nr:pirin family protein [Halobacteriovorax sp. JY17]PIK13610.1 MAG: quercetin 2,3-dioxygenase [Halobacteriovorax sp. JY17]